MDRWLAVLAECEADECKRQEQTIDSQSSLVCVALGKVAPQFDSSRPAGGAQRPNRYLHRTRPGCHPRIYIKKPSSSIAKVLRAQPSCGGEDADAVGANPWMMLSPVSVEDEVLLDSIPLNSSAPSELALMLDVVL